MKTAFVGAGAGCRAVLEMVEAGQLAILDLEILVVVDIDPEAPGMRLARERGWQTLSSIEQALALDDLELVIELTGVEEVLERIYCSLPSHRQVRVIDHVVARVFWDLEKATLSLREQLQEMTELEARAAADRAALREILDTIPDAVLVVDHQMRIVRVNRRFEELTGRPREAVVNVGYQEVFGGGRAGSVDFVSPFEAVLAARSPVTLIQQQESAPADTKYFEVTANPVFARRGERHGPIAQVVQTAHEITEQVWLRRETEEWARRFRQIVDTVHAVITVKDLGGRYQLVNPAAEALYRMPQEQLVGCIDAEVLPPGVAEIVVENDRRALEGGGYHVTEELLTLGGVEHVLVAERLPLSDYKGDLIGLCCVARDETRARRLQHDLLQAERLAAVGKLAADVAHELNNPLTGILTFAEDLLHEAARDDPARQDYELILNEAMRCRRIVRDLLDFSRHRRPERRRTQIAPIVRRALTMVERQAAFQNVTFEAGFADLPEISIDAAQIQQVILNLVINARDAMDGSGTITVRGEPGATGGVVLSVIDEGCGISQTMQERIFDPFFSTKGERGNGLGLPVVRSIVEQHGGRVTVHSQIGAGTTFRIELSEAASNKER